VNPLNALSANVKKTVDLANAAGTSQADFKALKTRLEGFAQNGQLSIFSGNWFDTNDKGMGGKSAYALPPELDLICTAHYLEALDMQAMSSEISGLLGGKMPHVMSSVPGGTTWVPTEEKLDDLLFRAQKIYEWVKGTMIPDTKAIVPYYLDVAGYGQGYGDYIAWGVFDQSNRIDTDRYLPAGVCSIGDSKVVAPDESKITEETIHSFYADSGAPLNPRQGITEPAYPNGGADLNGRYTWDKAARYDGKPYEAGGIARMISAYKWAEQNKDPNADINQIKTDLDGLLKFIGEKAGAPVTLDILNSTLGRVAARNYETLDIAEHMVSWTKELTECIQTGDTETFVQLPGKDSEGSGMWEAPRGALYHFERVRGGKIKDYQIIIPSTWNISPRDHDKVPGPLEKSLIGLPVQDMDKPIHALRTVHSFDPCVACSIHINEPATGKHFETVTSPWGVK
jgi:hydrogenase large subunit